MLNEYPLWKYLLLIFVIAIGALYATPNLYGEDPALQISATRQSKMDESTLVRIEESFKKASIEYKSFVMDKKSMSIRFSDTETQLKAMTVVKRELGETYTTALNLLPATPDWLASFNARPMYLGLDLRGGVHFLMEVDVDAAVKQREESSVSEMRSSMRKEKIRYLTVARKPATNERPAGIEIKFKSAEERDKANSLIRKDYGDMQRTEYDEGERSFLLVSFSDNGIRELKRYALQQNITTLRNRVNELGVAEPIIQQQGLNRIVVQLPGVQDTTRAKKILGTTATLEYRLVDIEHAVQDAINGHVPVGSKLYYERDGNPILLKKRTIVTGDQITNASSTIDQTNSQPAVLVTLNSKGARRMGDITKENIGKPMAVVFKEKRGKKLVEEVINVATIRDAFSKRFQTTGLDSSEEARDLALLLRAGSLSAPVEIIEERTVGPSLGKDNIEQGFRSVIIGFVVVLAFMAFWYRGFGLVANMALTLNLVLIVAVLSMLQATLTMPGIAGIVLTVGMAVDANVLIFERIREELRNGNTPQASIHAGYEKAFGTIADANVTTLIAAIVLFGFGTGPIKGFAITLSIGILTSMFTAIMGTRAVVNIAWGGRKKVAKLPV